MMHHGSAVCAGMFVVAGHLGWSLSRALMIAAAMFYAEHQKHSSKKHPINPTPPALTIFQSNVAPQDYSRPLLVNTLKMTCGVSLA